MSNKNNKGIKVIHDFNDFVEDREVILTLKDANILEGANYYEGPDILQNVELAEAYKTSVKLENKKQKVMDYEDRLNEGAKKLLPQYDEKPLEKEGFMLDDEGELNFEKQRKLDAIRSKLAGKSEKKDITLETSKTVASEYYSAEEMKKFRVPIKKPQAEKKKKEDIIAFLEDSLKDNEEDHGNRENIKREKAELDDMVKKKLKTENYEAALEKARAQTKHSHMIDEEYDEIERAIENQRRKALTQNKVKHEEMIKTLVENAKKIEEATKSTEVEIISTEPHPDGEKIEGIDKYERFEFLELTLINHNTDILDTMTKQEKLRENEFSKPSSKALSVKDTKTGTASIVNVSLPSEKILAWNKTNSGVSSVLTRKKEGTEEGNGEDKIKLTKEELKELKEEVKFIDEDTYEGGVMTALKNIREKGYLMQKELEVSGRTKDKTFDEELKKFGEKAPKEIKLEYRDDKGRLMTPKEAFRYQCWIFHGKKPGKNKMEKRLKKEERLRKSMTVTPDQMPALRALETIQKVTNQPYAIISQPRSQK